MNVKALMNWTCLLKSCDACRCTDGLVMAHRDDRLIFSLSIGADFSEIYKNLGKAIWITGYGCPEIDFEPCGDSIRAFVVSHGRKFVSDLSEWEIRPCTGYAETIEDLRKTRWREL